MADSDQPDIHVAGGSVDPSDSSIHAAGAAPEVEATIMEEYEQTLFTSPPY
jgi:hypothetical protein